NTTADIQSAFSKNTGQMIKAEEIETMVRELDRAFLLETPALDQKRRQVLKDFADSPIRHAAHVKNGYPENPLDLAAFLGKFFHDPKGPAKRTVSVGTKPAPLALFAPHIDFHRGGPAYAWAYQALSEAERPDLVLGLGVAHMSPNSPWVLTHKSYETPYGAQPV